MAMSKVLGEHTEFTVVTPIRTGMVPGELRSYEGRLASVLAGVAKRAEEGVPTGISMVPVIHFARWFILRAPASATFEGKLPPTPAKDGLPCDPDYVQTGEAACEPHLSRPSMLVFTANFDRGLKPYINQFTTQIRIDIDRIWGNCEGYPGAADFDRFWAYLRHHQVPVGAFYSGYPTLTVARIRELSAFRDHFDRFVARTRDADGRSVANIAPLFDAFLRERHQFTVDFPGDGGLYDEDQGRRIVEITK